MGSSVSTITFGSSEHGALSYKQYIDVAMKGTMYEKNALGIIDEKKRIHDETIQHGNVKQQEMLNVLNHPLYDTKPVTREKLDDIRNAFRNALKDQMTNNIQLVAAKNSSAENISYIPIISASSHATANQSVKKPIDKKRKKTDDNKENEYFIDKNKETDLLVYWECQKKKHS